MRKTVFLLVFFIFFYIADSVNASLLLINKRGDVILKVLAVQDPSELGIPQHYLAVTDVVNLSEGTNQNISLKREGESINLLVGQDKSIDVTNWKDDVVEIEERGEIKKIEIGLDGGKFSIKQAGITAKTDYSINIEPKENKLSLETPTGKKYLAVFPYDAMQGVLRSRFINKVRSNQLELREENKDIAYVVSGERVINLFNLYSFEVPVVAKVSASTGEITNVEQPLWLKLFGLILT